MPKSNTKRKKGPPKMTDKEVRDGARSFLIGAAGSSLVMIIDAICDSIKTESNFPLKASAGFIIILIGFLVVANWTEKERKILTVFLCINTVMWLLLFFLAYLSPYIGTLLT